MTTGGVTQGVYVVSDAEVAAGTFRVAPGPAVRVTGMAATTRGVRGGPLTPVYVVTDPSVRGVEGGEALPVSNLTGIRSPARGLAIPVYVVEDDGQFESGPWYDTWWQGLGIANSAFRGVYQGIGAPTFADSQINLANPGTNDLTADVNSGVIALGGQPPRAATFDSAIGWTWALNGNSIYDAYGYFHTGLTPQMGGGMMIRVNRQAGAAGVVGLCGSRGDGTERFMLQHASTTSTFYSPNAGLNITGVNNLGDNTFAFFGQKCYKNGVLVGTAAVGTVSPREIILNGRMESAGLNSIGITGSTKALIVTGVITPSDAEVLALHNAMMALAG
jgi:hypothetical protein